MVEAVIRGIGKVLTAWMAWPVFYQVIGALLLCALILLGVVAQWRTKVLAGESSRLEKVEKGWTAHPVPGKYFAEQQTTVLQGKTGKIYAQTIRLKADDGFVVGDFTIVKVFEGAHWARGASDALYLSGAKVDLVDELKSPRYRDLLAGAAEILCIGLASNNGDEVGNAALSLLRAQSLRDWVQSSGVAPDDATIAAIPFGKALDKFRSGDDGAENAQRPAVVIAVRRYRETINFPVLYDELLSRARLDTVDLSRYSRAGDLKKRGGP